VKIYIIKEVGLNNPTKYPVPGSFRGTVDTEDDDREKLAEEELDEKKKKKKKICIRIDNERLV